MGRAEIAVRPCWRWSLPQRPRCGPSGTGGADGGVEPRQRRVDLATDTITRLPPRLRYLDAFDLGAGLAHGSRAVFPQTTRVAPVSRSAGWECWTTRAFDTLVASADGRRAVTGAQGDPRPRRLAHTLWKTGGMRVHIGSDHAGLELKAHLLGWLTDHGHEPVDHGPFVYDALDDYPVFCLRAAAGVVADQRDGVEALGVVIGGSGNGEQIAANKVPGVRAALAWSDETAALGRQHNDANVVSIGGRMHPVDDMTRFVGIFLDTPFSGDERHARRIGQLAAYETTGDLPALPESARGHGPDEQG